MSPFQPPLPRHRRRSHIRVLTRRSGGGESGRGGLRRVVMVAAVLVVIGRVGGVAGLESTKTEINI